jgi:hypothetical protein
LKSENSDLISKIKHVGLKIEMETALLQQGASFNKNKNNKSSAKK